MNLVQGSNFGSFPIQKKMGEGSFGTIYLSEYRHKSTNEVIPIALEIQLNNKSNVNNQRNIKGIPKILSHGMIEEKSYIAYELLDQNLEESNMEVSNMPELEEFPEISIQVKIKIEPKEKEKEKLVEPIENKKVEKNKEIIENKTVEKNKEIIENKKVEKNKEIEKNKVEKNKEIIEKKKYDKVERISETKIKAMKVSELKEELKKRKSKVSGLKSELIKRLISIQ